MTTSPPRAFPPARGLTVGGLVRKPPSDWLLYLVAGAVAVATVSLAAVPVLLTLARLRPTPSSTALA